MRAAGIRGAVLLVGLLLGAAFAQAGSGSGVKGSKDKGWEVRDFGTFTLPLELGGQTKQAVVFGATVEAGSYRQIAPWTFHSA